MIERCSLKAKSNTGIGYDNLRLRHVAWLSRGAKKALAALLMIIERLALWPASARGTVAVALTKKLGGVAFNRAYHFPLSNLGTSALRQRAGGA